MKQKIILRILPLLFCLFSLSSCQKDEDKKEDLLPGLWIQQSITEDGVSMLLADDEKDLSLLIEANGVYRTYAKNGLKEKNHFGAWSVTNDEWLELLGDTWRLHTNAIALPAANQWAFNHVPNRFTILSVNANELQIRIKTSVGERRYFAFFVEKPRPVVTTQNVEQLVKDFQTFKTYIFTFKKG